MPTPCARPLRRFQGTKKTRSQQCLPPARQRTFDVYIFTRKINLKSAVEPLVFLLRFDSTKKGRPEARKTRRVHHKKQRWASKRSRSTLARTQDTSILAHQIAPLRSAIIGPHLRRRRTTTADDTSTWPNLPVGEHIHHPSPSPSPKPTINKSSTKEHAEPAFLSSFPAEPVYFQHPRCQTKENDNAKAVRK